MPVLSVLMAALRCRPWKVLWDELQRQAALLSPGAVELYLDVDSGERTSGMKRQGLSENSSGEYVLFVDDDDLVSPDYLELILAGCRTGVDVVTFDLKQTRPNKSDEIWTLGLHPNANRDPAKPRPMQANHLCAWRRTLAQQVGWCPALGYGDDEFWFRPLFAAKLVNTEHHIGKVLYEYVYHPVVTVNQQADRVQFAMNYMAGGLECSMDRRKEIWIQCGHRRHYVRNRHNEYKFRGHVQGLSPFYRHFLRY